MEELDLNQNRLKEQEIQTDEENRLFYDLERIWRDGKELDVSEFLK